MRQLLLLPALLLALPSQAADKPVEELLKKMRTQYASIKSAKFITKSTQVNAQGQSRTLRAETQYSSPSKIYSKLLSQTYSDEPMALITNGAKFITTGFPGSGKSKAYPEDQTALTSLIPLNLESLCFWDYIAQLTTWEGGNMSQSKLSVTSETWNNRKWTILREVADWVKPPLDIKYYVDPKTNLIWRTLVRNKKTQETVGDYELEKLWLGAKVDPSLFAKLNAANPKGAN